MLNSHTNSTTNRPIEHEWKRIPGHPSYAIRDDGLIASYKHGEPRILRPFVNKTGCGQVDLDGTRYSVSRLLRLVFQPHHPTPSDWPHQ